MPMTLRLRTHVSTSTEYKYTSFIEELHNLFMVLIRGLRPAGLGGAYHFSQTGGNQLNVL